MVGEPRPEGTAGAADTGLDGPEAPEKTAGERMPEWYEEVEHPETREERLQSAEETANLLGEAKDSFLGKRRMVADQVIEIKRSPIGKGQNSSRRMATRSVGKSRRSSRRASSVPRRLSDGGGAQKQKGNESTKAQQRTDDNNLDSGSKQHGNCESHVTRQGQEEMIADSCEMEEPAATHNAEKNEGAKPGQRSEGELLHLAITLKRDELVCKNCGAVGSLRKNGGTGPTMRSWKCKHCSKQLTGQMIPLALENQFGPGWRDQVMSAAQSGTNQEPGIPTTAGMEIADKMVDRSQAEGDSMITVPSRVWEKMVQKIETMSREQKKLAEQYTGVCQDLQRTKKRMERLENTCARNSLSKNISVTEAPHTRHKEPVEMRPTNKARQEIGALPSERSNGTKNQECTATIEPQGNNGQKNNATEGAPRPQKMNWAQITKMNRPNLTKIVPQQLQEKIIKSRELLVQGNFKQIYEPNPTALYFKNVRRGPLGLVRNALRESLPSWALLGLDFVGASVLEIITDEKLKDRTIATLKMMGITVIPGFDILEKAASVPKPGETPAERSQRNLRTAAYRLQKNVEKARNRWATKWYQNKLQETHAKIQNLEEPGNKTCTQGGSATEQAQGASTSQNDEGWQVVRRGNMATANRGANDPQNGSSEVEPKTGQVATQEVPEAGGMTGAETLDKESQPTQAKDNLEAIEMDTVMHD